MKIHKKLLTKIGLGLAAVSLGLAVFLYWHQPEKILAVNYLDIGQGSSVLIQTPYDQNIIIDGGDTDVKILRQLPRFMPFYDRTIDLVILTHPHDDHLGGLLKLLQRYRVKKIIYTGITYDSEVYDAWLEMVEAKNIPVIIADRPQTIDLGDDLTMAIIYPRQSLAGAQMENLNNSSVVTKLTYDNQKFLFMGDIEAEVEAELLAADLDLNAAVMLLGHHGSDTSSGEDFLNAVNPKIAVMQVGAANDFGHPSLRVLRRLERLGIKYYRNDLDGWVQVKSDGHDIIVHTER